MTTPHRKRIGRPTEYTPAVADKVINLILDGNSLNSIAGNSSMPSRQTLYNWLAQYPDFLYKYTGALPVRRLTMLNEVLEIVDSIPRAATSREITQARIRAKTRLRVSDRMEGKGFNKAQTRSDRKGRPAPNTGSLRAVMEVCKYLKGARESGYSLEDVITQLGKSVETSR
jgi:hypothetical protein